MQIPERLANTVIQDRYRLVSCIGQGGIGDVYVVEHTIVGRRYALKVLNEKSARNPTYCARFHREPRAAAAIGNPHIIEVVDMGYLDNQRPFIVMELLEGRDLRAELLAEGPFSIGRAIDIATQCCEALEAVHKKRIVHRDIKPENIFITKREDGSDFIKVLDFGISKVLETAGEPNNNRLTRNNAVLGTPRYMSLEQLNGLSDIDSRTDVYATGVVLFEMLTGHVPFEVPTFTGLVYQISTEPTPSLAKWRPDIPPELEKAIHRSLAKKRQERFASMAELAEALSPFAGNMSRTVIPSARRSESTQPGIGSRIDESMAQNPNSDLDISAEATGEVKRNSGSGSTLPGLGPPPDESPEHAIITTEIPNSRLSKTNLRIVEGLIGTIAIGATISFTLVYTNKHFGAIENHTKVQIGATNPDGPVASVDEIPPSSAHSSASGSLPIRTSSPNADSPRAATELKLARIIHHSRGASLGIRHHSAFASLTNTTSIRSDTKSTVMSNPYAIHSLSGELSRLEVDRANRTINSSKVFLRNNQSAKRSIDGSESKPPRHQPNFVGRTKAVSVQALNKSAANSPVKRDELAVVATIHRYPPERLPKAKSRANAVVRRPSTKRQSIITKKRDVTFSNMVRATVTVAIECTNASTTVEVPPRNRASASVPAERCRVSCTGMGRPACPHYLSANALSLEIR